MYKTKFFVITLLILVFVLSSLALNGCQTKTASETTAEVKRESGGDYTTETKEATAESTTTKIAETKDTIPASEISIGVSMPELISIYWKAQHDEVARYAKEKGWSQTTTVADSDPTKQDSQIRDLIGKGVKGIIVVPVDAEAILTSIKAVKDAGMPCVAMSRPPKDITAVDYYVGSDNYAFAVEATRKIGNMAKEKGIKLNLLEMVGDLRDQNAVDRSKGLNDTVKKEFSDVITIVNAVPTEWNLDKSLSGCTNALQANPEINAIFVPSDYLLPTIIGALQAANKLFTVDDPKHIIIAQIDGDPYGTKMIKDGFSDVDVAHDPWGDTQKAFNALVTLINGGTLEATKEVLTPMVVTKDNVESLGDKLWGNVYPIPK